MSYKYLDVIDLPSDPSGSLGSLRTKLLNAYNGNRSYETKIELLRETLTKILFTIEQGRIAAGNELPKLPKPEVNNKVNRVAQRHLTRKK